MRKRMGNRRRGWERGDSPRGIRRTRLLIHTRPNVQMECEEGEQWAVWHGQHLDARCGGFASALPYGSSLPVPGLAQWCTGGQPAPSRADAGGDAHLESPPGLLSEAAEGAQNQGVISRLSLLELISSRSPGVPGRRSCICVPEWNSYALRCCRHGDIQL